jgi:hypothetical protein
MVLGSGIQGSKSTQSRIPDPDPQHCIKGDFGVKIFFLFILRGSFRAAKFLTRVLSLI